MKKWNLGRLVAVVLVLGMVMSMTPALAVSEGADVVYCGGNIYTMDDDNPHATALAVKDGRLLYVGSDEGAAAYTGSNTRVVELDGHTVLPGLIEGHMHVPNLGQRDRKSVV